jgi:hypothetical protein
MLKEKDNFTFTFLLLPRRHSSGVSIPTSYSVGLKYMQLLLYALSLSAFSLSAFSLSAVLFQYHKEHQYPIHGHGRSCRACPLSCARSFTDSPRHFDSTDYKLRPLMVYHLEDPRTCHTRFRYTRRFAGTRPPAYNESHLDTTQPSYRLYLLSFPFLHLSLQKSGGIVSKVRPRPLPSTLFPIY